MAGRGAQNKGNLEKIKREMTAKKQKAQKQKQEVIMSAGENKELTASGTDCYVQVQDRPTESGMEYRKEHNFITEKQVREEGNQEHQDRRDKTTDTKKIKFVVFRVEEEEFALRVSNVKEIIRIPSITKLPNLPEHVVGLCSLRAGLLPVIDCRQLFAMPKQDFSENSRIIVTDINGKNVGLISDRVLEVIDVEEAAVKEPPASIKGINGGVFNGILILNDGKRVVMILAAEKIIDVDGIDEAITEHAKSLDDSASTEVHEDQEEQIVLFHVGTEEYAFHINHVKEIIRLPELVKVPNTADYVEGVFTIRNQLLTAIHMGKLLGMSCGQLGEQSRVIILNHGKYAYGVIVDKVSNVVPVPKRLFKRNRQSAKRINGIYSLNKGQRLIMMLEPQELISLEEAQGILTADQKKVENAMTPGSSEADNTNEYVVFRLGGEEYGIKIQNVQEVNRISEITHFPGAPEVIAGMVDLRGEIIPILNLRKLFDQQEFDACHEAKFIVVEFGNKKVGILVDLVSGVMRFSGENLEKFHESFQEKEKDGYIDQIAKLNDGKRVVMLLKLSTMLRFM